jgi:hypothetical protein
MEQVMQTYKQFATGCTLGNEMLARFIYSLSDFLFILSSMLCSKGQCTY